MIRESHSHAVPVANNATWSLGELALRMGPGIAPHAAACLQALTPLVADQTVSRNLRENVAICLGRISLGAAQPVAAAMRPWFGGWCAALGSIKDEAERDR